MSAKDPIIRIAARGDGVARSGQHVSGAVTGDAILQDGSLEQGPHHIAPTCPHFGVCGGCALQHADDTALRQFVTERVTHAAQAQEIAPADLLETHLSPAKTRRRAKLHAQRTQHGAVLGFREGKSRRIVDMQRCDILHPRLFALAAPLREWIAQYGSRHPVTIELALCDQGVDCALSGLELDGLEANESVLALARAHDLARLSADLGYGAAPIWEPQAATIRMSTVRVPFPSRAFLQATVDAERRMVQDVQTMLSGCEQVLDLFAGLGTFAFAMAASARVSAVEAARDAHLACKSAAHRHQLPLSALHRDLFRNPLAGEELAPFDAVILDPPRAGAREQIAALGQSRISRIVYISCNPMSWARDAARLVEAGFALRSLRPVGQFRWSTHVELVSYFER